MMLCLASPWPDQQIRYLVAVVPFLLIGVCCGLLNLQRIVPMRWRRWGFGISVSLFVVLLVHSIATWVQVHTNFFPVNTQVRDREGNPRYYRQLFEFPERIALDECINWIRANARPGAVVAAAMPQWVHLRTGLPAVMPPFETNGADAQQLIDTVPVAFLIHEPPGIFTHKYTRQLIIANPAAWQRVFTSAGGLVQVYERRTGKE
jgi:hypothetical protein